MCGEQHEEGSKQTIEAPSPDGKFAFRYTKDSKSDPDSESDLEKQSYDLIDKASGKVLTSVAESDPDLGPSARFDMTVLWRPDSKAFALMAFLWKRGTSLSVFRREGSTFREIEVPELVAEIPEKVKRGKNSACGRAQFTEREAMAKGRLANRGNRNHDQWRGGLNHRDPHGGARVRPIGQSQDPEIDHEICDRETVGLTRSNER